MQKGFLTSILLTFVLLSCLGPIPVIANIQYCSTAEAHLKALGCIPSDKPYTLKGKSFSQFCQETMQNGINLHPDCLSKIVSCNQINVCVQAK